MADDVEILGDGVRRIALRTPTLPPATHTNCYLVGHGELTVVDPASPWDDEQGRLYAALEALEGAGEAVERIFLTHHHHDHVAGAQALAAWLATRGIEVPIVAHPVTASLLEGTLEVDAHLEGGVTAVWGGTRIRLHHTPGHAAGHLIVELPDEGTILAGDMVAGVGTILIAPHEGHLGQYLDSLAFMRTLGAETLLPAHGEPLRPADAVLGFYIAHRHQRTQQIREVLDTRGASTPGQIVEVVYAEIDKRAWPIAEVQVRSHLDWMLEAGLARPVGEDRWAVAA
jgi:glyoxylase-like metal-dependent hydrolase (beta-lactamase superfamily II)